MGEMASAGYDAAVLERVAQRFRHDMWSSVPIDAVIEAGVDVRRFGPVQATVFAGLPEAHCLNQTQGAAEPGALGGGHLANAIEWVRSHEVDYRVPVAAGRPGAAAAESWLGERGYERGGGWVKLVRDGSPPSWPEDPAVAIYKLSEEEVEGEGLSYIFPPGFDLPMTTGTLVFSLPTISSWHCYTASPGGDVGVVAAALMLVRDGVAQLGPGVTLPEGRRRGCHRALLRRRIADAAAAGCHTMFVELGEYEPSQIAAERRNFLRAGFREAYGSRNWQRPALHPAAQIY